MSVLRPFTLCCVAFAVSATTFDIVCIEIVFVDIKASIRINLAYGARAFATRGRDFAAKREKPRFRSNFAFPILLLPVRALNYVAQPSESGGMARNRF